MQDERPPVWVGHISLPTPSVHETAEFMLQVGMRAIVEQEEFAVLELRGGTHLVLSRSEKPVKGPAPFDLMVDDLDSTYKRFVELGLNPSEVRRGRIHDSFDMIAPSGHTITFNSTHVSGPV